MPEENVIEYQDDNLDVRLVLGRGTALARMRRAIFSGTARVYLEQHAEEYTGVGLTALQVTVSILYPDLLAAVDEATGLDVDTLGVDEFLALPDTLTSAWEMAVYRLIPHWAPQFNTSSETEKKDSGDTSKPSS